MSSTQSQFSGCPRILVVDDEFGIRDGLKNSLEQMGFDVETAGSGEEALQQFKNSKEISCVISDFRMPGMSGFDVLREVKRVSPMTRVVLMTGYGSVHHAVNAMQLGADDYLCKPFHVGELEKIILRGLPKEEALPTGSILTSNLAMQMILRKAERVAKSATPILIEGPSGTGKELLARQIHEWSPRSDRPWVAINCAALPGGLLESELFGFEKGAFTGAVERKAGKFELAHTGTLLLDEIGELDPILQAKLLRVLQEGEIDRLGGRKPLKVDVRIIATTNKDLEKLVFEGKFREDLYFRLYGVKFALPPLKDRPEDIELLAHEFLARQAKLQNRDLKFSDGVMATLKERQWSGNIRELERAIERSAVLSESGLIQSAHFEFRDTEYRTTAPKVRFEAITNDEGTRNIREMERDIILSALEAHHGNRTHTAKALGMSLRTLRHKLKQYREAGIEIEGQKLPSRLLPHGSVDASESVTRCASTHGQDLA